MATRTPPWPEEREALIREARARQRKRWLGIAVAVAVLAGLGFGLDAILSGVGPRSEQGTAARRQFPRSVGAGPISCA